MVWGILLSRRLVSEPVGSTQYRVFESDMADLSDRELRHGMAKTKDFTGFFTTPAFREMARMTPEDLGLPDAKTAYIEACNAQGDKTRYNWSHPAVYFAADETGFGELRSRTEFEIYPLFRRNYEIMVNRVMEGEKLDMPTQKALPPKVFIQAEPVKARATLDRMKAMLG